MIVELVTLATLGYLSYEDMKTRTVRNSSIFFLLILGLIAWFMNFNYLVFPLMIIISICSYLSWRFKVFGAGDAKLFMVLVLIFPALIFQILILSHLLLIAFQGMHSLRKMRFVWNPLPFVPFIALGTLSMFLLSVYYPIV